MNLPSGPAPRRHPAAALALVCAVLLAGCGLRLDSPPPTEPVPDPVEIIRRTAVDDALLVADQAEVVAARKATKPAVAEALAQIAEISLDHAEQLGGVYESGLEPDQTTPSPSRSQGAEPGPRRVLATLRDASARNATAADVCDDGALARLLASISAAQTLSARKLAETSGNPLPPPVVPAGVVPGDTSLPGAGTSAAGGDGAGDGNDDEGSAAKVAASPARPATAPTGLAGEDLDAMILAEDSTGYVFEVTAAWSDDEDVRTRLVERALAHRQRAEQWARVAGVDGTETDPRRAAYQLPDRATAPQDTVLEAESRLADAYANVVGLADPSTRATVVALLTDSAVTLRSWGAGLLPFPGLPERSPSA